MRISAQNLIDIKPQLADLLSNLEVGDSVRGKIIELLGESISLRTASGQILTAALQTDTALKQGQNIELVINDINEDGIFAELKPDGGKQTKLTETSKLQQVFSQMDIKPDKGSIEAAKLLLKYNMPITKENVQQLVNTQKSIETLAKADVFKALALLQSGQNLSNTDVTKLVKQVIKLEPETQETIKLIQQSPVDVTKDGEAKLEKPATNQTVLPDDKSEKLPQGREMMLDPKSITVEKKAQKENTPKQALQQIVEQLDSEELQKAAPKVEKLIDTLVKVFETASKAQPEHSAYLISKDMEVTPAAIKALEGNIDSNEKLGSQVKELEKLVDVLEQNQVDVKELKQAVKKLFLKPENLQDKEHVQETIKELVKTAGKIESLIRNHGIEDKVDKTVLSDIKDNISFQQNINSHVNYIQIPIMINENKTTADLYVFGNKKKGKTVNPENASILIALDLESIGHIESLIGVSQKAVNLTFKVEKDKLRNLIYESIDSLKQALEARGYSLNPVQIIDARERFSLLELEEEISPKQNKMHLDIKV